MIPNGPIHHDADYFPNSQTFDPDRFSAENRAKIVPGSYMPFGQGPRNCIGKPTTKQSTLKYEELLVLFINSFSPNYSLGSRLALDKVKTAVTHLILNFILEPCDKTHIPIKLAKNCISAMSVDGIWLKLRLRK